MNDFRVALDELVVSYALLLEVHRPVEMFPIGADPTGGLPPMTPGECVDNARAVQRVHGHDLAVGFGLAVDGWTGHVWNLTAAGAIDVTWRPIGSEYRGVRLTRRDVDRAGRRLDDAIDLANELRIDPRVARHHIDAAHEYRSMPRRQRRALARRRAS